MLRGSKLHGEEVELAFMLQAVRHGLAVSKPFGDSRKYDAIVDADHRLSRVQVKSGNSKNGRGYHVNAASGGPSNRRTYQTSDVDFLAAYIPTLGVWYILPIEVASKVRSFSLGHATGKYEQYKNAWDLFGRVEQSGS